MLAGTLWGAVAVTTTRAEPFAAGAEQRLSQFAELVAQALANAEARSELAASRVRIVQTADLERRRLERNLHDGAQQRLVGLALALRLAEDRVERDPDGAVDLLSRARAELGEALDELRELARGIHPAVLSDHGLRAALPGLASRCPVETEVETDVGRLDEAVEVAAYFTVSEALANVAKYSRASRAHVTATRVRRLARGRRRRRRCRRSGSGARLGAARTPRPGRRPRRNPHDHEPARRRHSPGGAPAGRAGDGMSIAAC